MPNICGIIKSLQNIMRKDQGVSGDAQRIEQLGWMITLKIIDDKEAEMELLNDDYVSVIPSALQWRSWAGDIVRTIKILHNIVRKDYVMCEFALQTRITKA